MSASNAEDGAEHDPSWQRGGNCHVVREPDIPSSTLPADGWTDIESEHVLHAHSLCKQYDILTDILPLSSVLRHLHFLCFNIMFPFGGTAHAQKTYTSN